MMDKKELLSHVDHTQLTQTAVWEDIRKLCDEAVTYKTASICIPPSYVKQAKDYVGDSMAVCTVVGFPNGYHTTSVKLFETREALENGADEIDMVVNLGWVREGRFDLVEQEIRLLKEACGRKILKVIIETCLLNEKEKIQMCRTVSVSGADYIKTSTGFSKSGAAASDIRLFAEHLAEGVKIKAAGGIGNLEDAQMFLELGADRLGSSRMIHLVREQER